MIAIERLDHLVLTVVDIERTCAFYAGLLGVTVETFGQGRKALRFGGQRDRQSQFNATRDRRVSPRPWRRGVRRAYHRSERA